MARPRGTKPKPAALRLLEGNPGHRPIKNEPLPPKHRRAPKAPTWLPEEAQKIWQREAKVFFDAGVLTSADINTFAAYCEAAARYKAAVMLLYQAPTFMIRTASGALIQHPYLAIVRAASKDMMNAATEFGGTPSSRARIDVGAAGMPETDDERRMFGD